MLSHPVTILALAGHYPTNKLIVCGPVPKRRSFDPEMLYGITCSFPQLSHTQGLVTHMLLSLSPLSTSPKGSFSLDLHA